MIITCNSCYKKFEIDSNLIPETGRLLECGNCKNQWFFKKNDAEIDTKPIKKIETKSKEIYQKKVKQSLEQENPENIDISEKNKITSPKNKKRNIGILNVILIFIITMAALILLIDTFKMPISIFIPNIEFILYNLYESIKDIILFFKDLS